MKLKNVMTSLVMVLLVGVLAVGLTACGSKSTDKGEFKTGVYYSDSGNNIKVKFNEGGKIVIYFTSPSAEDTEAEEEGWTWSLSDDKTKIHMDTNGDEYDYDFVIGNKTVTVNSYKLIHQGQTAGVELVLTRA
jgi:hypothetical protein